MGMARSARENLLTKALELCDNMDLKPKGSNSWNPQSNAMLERVHQVFGDMLRTFELDEAALDENEQFQKFLTIRGSPTRLSHRHDHRDNARHAARSGKKPSPPLWANPHMFATTTSM